MQSIIADEYDGQNDDKQHLKYYIGVCMEDDDGSLLLGTSITLQTFFSYDIVLDKQISNE
jgi:hypothetical protein